MQQPGGLHSLHRVVQIPLVQKSESVYHELLKNEKQVSGLELTVQMTQYEMKETALSERQYQHGWLFLGSKRP